MGLQGSRTPKCPRTGRTGRTRGCHPLFKNQSCVVTLTCPRLATAFRKRLLLISFAKLLNPQGQNSTGLMWGRKHLPHIPSGILTNALALQLIFHGSNTTFKSKGSLSPDVPWCSLSPTQSHLYGGCLWRSCEDSPLSVSRSGISFELQTPMRTEHLHLGSH